MRVPRQPSPPRPPGQSIDAVAGWTSRAATANLAPEIDVATTPVTADSDSEDRAQVRERIVEMFARGIPHGRALGVEILDYGEGWASGRLPFREEFIGDPEAGLLQTSVGISLMDGMCGLSVFLCLPTRGWIATLDLRMEYLRPAVAGQALNASAECHRMTKSVAFSRGRLFQDDPERPTALCTATFIRTDTGNDGK